MLYYEKQKPLIKRLPIIVDSTEGIQRYDLDNLYPQRCEELIGRSYTLNSVMKTVADFLNGEGFADEQFGSMIANPDGFGGQTFNDVLNDLSPWMAKYETIPLHIGYNLNYSISSIRVLDFDFIRFGEPAAGGMPLYMKYCTNWENDMFRRELSRRIEKYHIFNPDPEQVAFEIEQAGGIENYKGQILYYTPKPFRYAKATFDPVYDHAQVQGEAGVFKLAQIQNSFLATLAILYPGEFESGEERGNFNRLVSNKSGARHAGSHIGLQDKSGTRKVNEVFLPITPTNIDKLYEFTETSAMKAIIENEGIPKILIGVQAESGLFNSEDIEQAYTYVNARTRNRRARISRLFAYLMQFWETPYATDAAIKEQQYIVKDASASTNTAVESLTDLSGRGNQNLQRILREFKKGTNDRNVTIAKLKLAFGISDEQAESLLNDDPSDDPQLEFVVKWKKR